MKARDGTREKSLCDKVATKKKENGTHGSGLKLEHHARGTTVKHTHKLADSNRTSIPFTM